MIVAPQIESYLAALVPDGPSPEPGGEGIVEPRARPSRRRMTRRSPEPAGGEGIAEGPPPGDRIVGRFIETLLLAAGARRVLEIGTGDGRSALRLARRLPEDGDLLSIEIDPRRAATARRRLEEAGFGERAHVIVGDPARMVHKVAGPFDVVVNAGDRRQFGPLLDRLVTLLRPGGTLITTNVLGGGEVVPGFADPPGPPADETAAVLGRGKVVPGFADPPGPPADETAAVADYNRRLAADPRLTTAFLPVGDGLAVSVKAR